MFRRLTKQTFEELHAAGVSIAYEPVFPIAYLGQSRGSLIDGFLNGYWEALPEVEFRDVTSAAPGWEFGIEPMTNGTICAPGRRVKRHFPAQ